MPTQRSDLGWLFKQLSEAFSWTGISWFVALGLGIWGAMIGIGAFAAAYVFLGLCFLLCAFKWGHVTSVHTQSRRGRVFVGGLLVLFGIAASVAMWTYKRKIQAEEDVRRLEPLAQIPALKHQLDDLPSLRQKILDLQAENKTAADAVNKKQQFIEGLAQTVISQQRIIAASAHQDLQKTQTVLAANINQYRTDTNSAVSKILRPPRTLGSNRKALVDALTAAGPHEFAVNAARGNQEALDFANEITKAFEDAGWKITRTRVGLIISDGQGLGLWVHDRTSPLNVGQLAVAKAFNAIGLQLQAQIAEQIKADSPADIYVGLQ